MPEVNGCVLRLAVLVRLAGLSLMLAMLPMAAGAESATTTLPDPLTPAATEALVARLSDNEVRDLLLSELGARAAAEAQSAPLGHFASVEATTAELSRFIAQVTDAIGESPQHARVVVGLIGDYLAGLGTAGGARFLGALVLAVALGFGADRLYARRLGSWQAARGVATADRGAGPPFPSSVPILTRRLLRDSAGAVLALAVGAVVVVAILPEREARVAMTVLIWLLFLPHLVFEVLRFFLSPRQPGLRLADLDDATARFFMYGLILVAVVLGVGETLTRVAVEVGGGQLTQGAGFWLSTVIYLLLIAIVVIGRRGLRRLLQNSASVAENGESRLALAYPALALVAILGTWAAATASWAAGEEQAVQQARHVFGLALLLIAPMCDTMIRATARLLVPPMRGSGPRAERARAASVSSGIRIARVVVFGAILLAIAGIWRISFFGVASAGVGEALARRMIGALLILLVGYVFWELVRLSVNRRLANEAVQPGPALVGAEEADEGPQGGAASRLATVLPPIGFALQVAVIVISVLSALDYMGLNVAPLLAGAGVAGIAIGFGAQKLVADVVSGLFFLIEDAFRANEYLSASGIEGTVERLSIRSLHLRQSNGALNCIPYSNISAITNMGRDWGTMKQIFTIPFDTDIEKVRKIFKRIGQDLLADPIFAPAFLQPFKYKGVREVNDVGIVVSGKFMFRPELSLQFLIQREVYRRVHADFAAAGLSFARREVRVVVDGAEADSPQAARAAGAAAALPSPVDLSNP